jgi:gamma-tubulin complex component 2
MWTPLWVLFIYIWNMSDLKSETAMSNMVHRILGMSRCYVNLSKYVERHTRFEYGVINHALSSVVTSVLREYLLFIAQLENQLNQGKLTLQVSLVFHVYAQIVQKLWVHVQPSMRTLEILDKIMSEVTTNFGGDLLNQIYNKTLLTGYISRSKFDSKTLRDQQSKDLLLLLMEKASKPFFDMLEQWIYKGVIQVEILFMIIV